MKSKLLLVGLVVGALLLAGLWSLLGSGDQDAGVGPGELLGPAETDGSAQLEEITEEQGEAVLAREQLAARAAPVEVVATDDSWASELGGVTGRVVEEDGTVVEGISIALLQVDAGALISGDWAAFGESGGDLVLARARTDEEGRFRLNGAYDASYHGLGIDLRGPRCSLRVVDTQLHHGEVTDLGDIVLAAGCTVFGRVVDEQGTPIANARVRIAPAPPEGLDQAIAVNVQDVRSDCAVGISMFVHDRMSSPVVEPPPLVRRHLDDMPFPTMTTDVEGKYRFEGAPIGSLVLGVDRPGSLGVLRLETTTLGEVEFDDAVLTAGRTAEGVVFDMEGEPIVGAEVMAGSEFAGVATILQPAGRTDEDGEFSVTGLPPDGNLMAVARRQRDEPWVGVIAPTSDELEIELETVFRAVVNVVDLAGTPLSGCVVEVVPDYPADSTMRFARMFEMLGSDERPTRFQEVEPGVYACDELAPGLYEVRARPKLLSSARATFTLEPGGPVPTVRCEQGERLALHVRDAVTGEPVSRARASVIRPSLELFRAVAAGRTDRDGNLDLGPFSLAESERGPSGRVRNWEAQLLVQHPRYADATIDVLSGMQVAEVALQPGGEVRGRIVWGQDPPQRIYMLTMDRQYDDEGVLEAFTPPRLGRSGIDGSFRFSNLVAGVYRLQVYERWLEGEPLALMMSDPQPVLVHREDEVEVIPGTPLDLTIDLSPDGNGQTASLEGLVRLDGRPLEGAKVRVHSIGPGARATTDADGRYVTQGFLVMKDSVRVTVTGEIDGNDVRLHTDTIEPVPGSVSRLDVDAQSRSIVVRVLKKGTGLAIPEAKISISGSSGSNSDVETDELGEARVLFVGSREQQITVRAEECSPLKRPIALDEVEADGVLEIELSPSVPCAGECDLTPLDFTQIQSAYLSLSGDGYREFKQLDAADIRDDGRAAFTFDGTGPGTYRASFYIDGDWREGAELEIPEDGSEDLVITHPGQSD